MTQIEKAVAHHYGAKGLTATMVAALQRMGKPTEPIDPEDLSEIDEFHIAGREATALLAPQLGLGPRHRVVDLGSGIGGPARLLARSYGCQVDGIDLTPEFVETAQELTRRSGLAGKATFQVGSVTALPFPDASFDAATLFHVGMNLPDKPAMAREAARVLKRGGQFLIFDIMRTSDGGPEFPVPWSREAGTSFVATPESYRQALEAAGLAIAKERSHLDLAKDFFARMRARAGDPRQPPSNVALLLGDLAKPALANVAAAFEAGQLAPVEIVARKDR